MNDLVFNVLLAVIALILGVITRYVVPWLKERIQSSKWSWVYHLTYKLVSAAEQYIKTGGADKKTYVTDLLKDFLVEKNLSLSDSQIGALIEATVNELFPHKE